MMKDIAKKATLHVTRSRPDFLIIGTQKAGTTSLHQYLSTHPAIYARETPKELHFFNIYFERGLAWYLSQFPTRLQKRGKLCFESTPDYLDSLVAPARIQQKLGSLKLIAILREPADRAYSAWKMWHNYASMPHKQDHRSFAEAIESDPTYSLESRLPGSDRIYHYVSKGRYAEQLEPYLGQFLIEDILVLDYGEMCHDLQTFLNKICKFLSIGMFDAEEVASLGQQKFWASMPRPMRKDELDTLDALRAYYAPLNEDLWRLLGRRFDW